MNNDYSVYLLGSTELSEKAWWSTDENELRSPVIEQHSLSEVDIDVPNLEQAVANEVKRACISPEE